MPILLFKSPSDILKFRFSSAISKCGKLNDLSLLWRTIELRASSDVSCRSIAFVRENLRHGGESYADTARDR